MPAYRSAAEGEVRDAVGARLRQFRPEARIIHEINVSTYGPNRVDLMAVSPSEIIAVEVKSAKDKLDRLPKQIASMKGCSHHVVAALHEKFLVEQTTNAYAAHSLRDGTYYLGVLPEAANEAHEAWVFPERRRAMPEAQWDHIATWKVPRPKFEGALPSGALDMLWRDELQWLCGSLGIPTSRRSVMTDMVAALRWHCAGRELTLGICAALRARQCVEADPAIAIGVAA